MPQIHRRRMSGLVFAAALATAGLFARADTFTWPGTSGGDQLWSNTANWTGGVIPVEDPATILQFNTGSSGYNAINDLGDPFSLFGILLRSTSAADQTISGSPIEFISGANGPTPSLISVLSVAGTAHGAFTIQNTLQVPTELLLNNTVSPPLTLAGSITGPGKVTVFTGNIVLTGDNTYSGGTTLAQGDTSVLGNGSLGTGPVNLGVNFPGGPQIVIGGITGLFLWPHLRFDSAANVHSGDSSVSLNAGAYLSFNTLDQAAINRLTGSSSGVLALEAGTSVAPVLDLSAHPNVRIGTYAPSDDNAVITLSATIIPGGATYRFGGQSTAGDFYTTADTLNVASLLTDGPSLFGRGVNIGSSKTTKGGKVQLSNNSNSYSRGTVVESNFGVSSGMTALEFSFTPPPGATPLGTGPLDAYGTLLFDGQFGGWGSMTNPVIFHPGSELIFNQVIPLGNNSFTSTNTERWPDQKGIALNGTTLTRKAWSTIARERVGPITFENRSRIVQDLDLNQMGTTGIDAASFVRVGHGTLELFTANPVSALGGAATVTTASTAGLVDPGTGMVNPYMLGWFENVAFGSAAHFLQVDPNGTFQMFTNYASSFNPSLDNQVVYPSDPSIPLSADQSIWALRMNSRLTINSGVTLTIRSGGLILSTGDINGGTIRFANGIKDVEGIIHSGDRFNGTETHTIRSTLATTAGITKFGPQPITLAGDNTFSGGLFINDGSVKIGSTGALNAAAPNPVYIDTFGTLDLNNFDQTLPALTGTGTVTNTGAAAHVLTINTDSDIEFGGTLSATTSTRLGLTKTGAGTLTLSGAGKYTGATTISAGTLRLSPTAIFFASPIMNNATLRIEASGLGLGTIEGTGQTVIDGNAAGAGATTPHIRQGSLHLVGPATLSIAPDGTAAGLSSVSELQLDAAARLDLGNNDLVVSYSGPSPLGQISQYARAGQLIASDEANHGLSPFGRTLAIWDNNNTRFGSFDGMVLPDFNQVLVKYTYFGDANLDGQVTPTDYAIVDGNIGPGHDWSRGDLNGDGNTTPADYALIDGNIGAGNGATGGPQLITVSAVPEPSMGGIFLAGLALVARRRRRAVGLDGGEEKR